MGTERGRGGWWPDADEEGQYHKEQAYGTTDLRLVDSDRRSYVLQFGHLIHNPTLSGCYCGGLR
jgi:hypothetical protein